MKAKKKWKPKEGDKLWWVSVNEHQATIEEFYFWDGDSETVNTFRTRKEALVALKAVKKVLRFK